MSAVTTWTQLRTTLAARWQALSTREQHALSGLAAVLAVVLFWAIGIAPAWQTLREADAQRSQLAQQHAQMLSWQTQAQELQQRTPLSRDEALRSLNKLSSAAGNGLQLQVQGERVSVQLKAVPASTLADWLSQARAQAQALPLEAHLTRSSAGVNDATSIIWDGQVVLSLPTRATPTTTP